MIRQIRWYWSSVKELGIDEYLVAGLTNRGIVEAKDFQVKAFDKYNQGENCFINSCTGSGKTLAYLLPILNHTLQQKQNPLHKGTSIILTLNKELCLQIYRYVRMLDPQNRINIIRTGPITHQIPVITELNKGIKTQQEQDDLNRKINENIINTINYNKQDIIVSTPQLLYNAIVRPGSKEKPLEEIAPTTIVVDQADLLLEIDRNVANFTHRLIQLGKKVNKDLRFIVACSSFPNKVKSKPTDQFMRETFSPITTIDGQSKHKLPKEIDIYFIEMDKQQQPKTFYVTQLLQQKPHQKVIIFCNSAKSVQQLAQTLENLNIRTLQYHANLDSTERSRVLQRFDSEDINVLVSTDLGSRGLNFHNAISSIIEYQMAENITNYINRAGRTGRNGIKGELISLVEEKNRFLFDHLKEVIEGDYSLSELFSRKRSFSKSFK